DVYLSDESIARNVAFGEDLGDIDRRRVEEVGRLAALDEWVATLPQGYDTPVGERGARVSGGQRQRIALARALYAKPELVVLDEGTSALDPRTEAMIAEHLRAAGFTVVWVTHRLGTVRGFDRIHVFEGGRLVASGTHETLLVECEAYRTQLEAAGGEAGDIG
ncbi:MAG: ABC transporter ATP-binding protein, partial [Phycisphaerales bacterium]|nr:ABC transporter ATP-binding protein [Phycisphaerales bacterium]